jgi:hypothetical protein
MIDVSKAPFLHRLGCRCLCRPPPRRSAAQVLGGIGSAQAVELRCAVGLGHLEIFGTLGNPQKS